MAVLTLSSTVVNIFVKSVPKMQQAVEVRAPSCTFQEGSAKRGTGVVRFYVLKQVLKHAKTSCATVGRSAFSRLWKKWPVDACGESSICSFQAGKRLHLIERKKEQEGM